MSEQKSYRALFTADLHMSNNLPWAKQVRVEGYTDRLQDVCSVLQQMRAYAKRNEIKHVWILGDLADKRLMDGLVLKALAREVVAFGDEDIELLVVPGNHEATDAAAHAYNIEWLSHLGVRVFNEFASAPIWEFPKFVPIPHKPDSVVNDWLAAFAKQPDCADYIILMHQDIVGGKRGEWMCPTGIGTSMLKPFWMTLAGHFHVAQLVDAEGRVRYLGAPLQHTFGDEGGLDCFHDISFIRGGGKPKYTHLTPIPTDSPKFFTLRYAIGEGWKDESFATVSKIGKADYVRIIVRGPISELKDVPAEVGHEQTKLLNTVGVRMARVILDPIPEKRRRIEMVTDEEGRFSLPDAVIDFVEAAEYGDALDKKTLIGLGLRALRSGGK